MEFIEDRLGNSHILLLNCFKLGILTHVIHDAIMHQAK